MRPTVSAGKQRRSGMRFEPDRQMLRIRQQVEEARRAGGAVDEAPALHTAASLLDVAAPPPLRPEALARIRRGVDARLAPARESRRWRWSLSVAVAIAVLVSAV